MNGIDAFWQFFVPGFAAGAAAMWAIGRMRRHSRGIAAAEGSNDRVAAAAANEAPASDAMSAQWAEPVAHSRLIDVGAARAAGFNMKHADDLTIIEGIGPRIEELLRANGIDGFAALAALDSEALAGILEVGGASFRFANPSDWAQQAALAADNQWIELKQLQRERIGDASAGDV